MKLARTESKRRLSSAMKPLLTALLVAGCLTLPDTPLSGDSPWPTFRGSDRSGVSSETGLLSSWPDAGPELLWTAEGLGRGYSSVAVADGRIYTMGDQLSADQAGEFLLCLDQDGGRQIWAAPTGKAWDRGKPTWQSSRSTPTVDGDRVYALTAFGDLIAFSTGGEQLWRKSLKTDFGGRKADSWGYSESVLVDGPILVCTPGGPEQTMVAMDKVTGEVKWTASRPGDRGAGHASIVISKLGGTKVYVTTTGSGAMGVRAADGELLWTYEIDKTTAVIPTPIVNDDLVFFAAGYRRGGALIRQVPKANSITIEEVYPLNSKLANKHGGVILVDGHLFGDSDDQGILYCADFMTGKQRWKSRGPGRKSASLTAADGHLYVRYSSGDMALVEATPERMNVISSFKPPSSGDRPSWSHPVIAGGRLYLRENGKLLCYALRK